MFPNSGQKIGQNYWQYFCNLLWNSCPQERSNCEVMKVMWRFKTKDLSFWPFFKMLCCCYFSVVASKLIGQFCKSFLPFYCCQTIHRCPYFRMKFPDCLFPFLCTWSFHYFKFILFQQNEFLEVHSVEVFNYGIKSVAWRPFHKFACVYLRNWSDFVKIFCVQLQVLAW